MGLRMYFKKNILVYGLFYLTIMTMISINDVFIAMPLTIKILGIGEGGYYSTYGWQLWVGRAILLVIIYVAFRLSLNKFIKGLKNV